VRVIARERRLPGPPQALEQHAGEQAAIVLGAIAPEHERRRAVLGGDEAIEPGLGQRPRSSTEHAVCDQIRRGDVRRQLATGIGKDRDLLDPVAIQPALERLDRDRTQLPVPVRQQPQPLPGFADQPVAGEVQHQAMDQIPARAWSSARRSRSKVIGSPRR
jgi:hypothetical protein